MVVQNMKTGNVRIT